MEKNWTIEDELMLESDVKDSIMAVAVYCGIEPPYGDVEEVDFNEFCDSFFQEF